VPIRKLWKKADNKIIKKEMKNAIRMASEGFEERK